MMENFNDPYHASRLHEPLQTFAPSGMSDFFDWRDGMGHISRSSTSPRSTARSTPR
jgi:hypothetical protein